MTLVPSNAHRVEIIAPPVGGDDWTTRSTAAGVTFASRLDNQTELNTWMIGADSPTHVFRDTVLKPTGATASTKFLILNADGENSGGLTIPLNATFGAGQTVWVSFRMYLQAQEAFQAWPPAPTAATKYIILSRYGYGPAPSGSSVPNEYVLQSNEQVGMILGYHQDGGGFPPIVAGSVNVCSSSDFRTQMSIDNGPNPLSGTNPDTGSAWTACEQFRRQCGGVLYSAYSPPGAANVKRGFGDPFSGGFRAYPNEWLTLTMRVIIGNFGSANNRLTAWAAREGQAYIKLWDVSNVLLGSWADYNGVSITPFTTNRVSGGRQVSSRTGQLASCFEIWTVNHSHTIGSGTLSYNATTQRLTWQAAGDSAGTARGFSVANNILMLNLMSSTSATNYLAGRVTPANLPTSGTTTETVVIGNGRPDTQRNYADFIASSQPINAPGGFAPT